LLALGERCHAYTHLSHVYAQGSSVYSTFVFRVGPDFEAAWARWTALKAAVSEAVVHMGGTISHQHGVGKDHARYLAAEKGAELGVGRRRGLGSQVAANPVQGQRSLGVEDLPGQDPVGDRPAGAHAHRHLQPQVAELLQDDHGAWGAHPVGHDRQRLSIARVARVAPEPPVVVEHLRFVGQLLGEGQRAARVAADQCTGRQRCGRVNVTGFHGLGRRGYSLAMAKNEKKSKKKKGDKGASRSGQVRAAVDQAFQTAGSTLNRDRAQEVADELATAAQRFRDVVEDALPPTSEELKRLGDRLAVIERRLGALERAVPASKRATAKAAPGNAGGSSASTMPVRKTRQDMS